MKLTIEENRERIKRFNHIKPASLWGSGRCFAKCPGVRRRCTRERGHAGPHVAHGTFRRVVAVWDTGARSLIPKKRRRGVRPPVRQEVSQSGSLASILGRSVGRLLRRLPSPEEGFLLLLALAMVVFAIDWALRILGLR